MAQFWTVPLYVQQYQRTAKDIPNQALEAGCEAKHADILGAERTGAKCIEAERYKHQARPASFTSSSSEVQSELHLLHQQQHHRQPQQHHGRSSLVPTRHSCGALHDNQCLWHVDHLVFLALTRKKTSAESPNALQIYLTYVARAFLWWL